MAVTLVEKILGFHSSDPVEPGALVELSIDARVARDFGGANVVRRLQESGLGIDDPNRTFFTFDCNPTGSDQGYAANQQFCRTFARQHTIRVFDIDRGIGTHIVLEEGLAGPGQTCISTDSHANILGAVACFGQGMGDVDIAHAFAFGTVWFKVPATVRVRVNGKPSEHADAKDLTLAFLRHFGSRGLLGCAAEVSGEAIGGLDLPGRITLASMATETGAIILFPEIGPATADEFQQMSGLDLPWPAADRGAEYEREESVDVEGIGPLISRPGHPEDVVAIEEVEGLPIDSAFLGSCTNGRLEDLRAAARILERHPIKKGVVLKIVPATDRVWVQALEEGLLDIFKKAGALVSNAGCAGCAAGQVGQTGPGEVTVSTGNRNFAGKQGLGSVYLASPRSVTASAVAGEITAAHRLEEVLATRVLVPASPPRTEAALAPAAATRAEPAAAEAGVFPETDRHTPLQVEGRAWVLPIDSVDTDMIYHNRHLAETDLAKMGQHALGNIPGWEDFPQRVQPGDVLIVGENFGAGSSRQQAVDCFQALGVSALIGASFGAIYERNAVNAGLPLLIGDLREHFNNEEPIRVDLEQGVVKRLRDGTEFQITPLSPVQIRIYQRGGLLVAR